MKSTQQAVIRSKVGLLRLAEELRNVSRARQVMGESRDAFYVGHLKRVGRIYQQTFVGTYANVAHAKPCTNKKPMTAADLLNDRVLPFSKSTASRSCIRSEELGHQKAVIHETLCRGPMMFTVRITIPPISPLM